MCAGTELHACTMNQSTPPTAADYALAVGALLQLSAVLHANGMDCIMALLCARKAPR